MSPGEAPRHDLSPAEQLDRLWSTEQIRQLVARYAHHLDRRDLDRLGALFAGDVRPMFERALREVQVTILNVGTHVIDFVDADQATGSVYCKAEIQDGKRWIHQAIRYDDTYVRRDGAWYFLRRDHQLFYGADVGTSPLGLPPANWPESHTGQGTLPYDQPSWQQFWGASS